jgi:NAD(P)-dependent dehydrogenase (short-subunit alcohol dehydrogenase family)
MTPFPPTSHGSGQPLCVVTGAGSGIGRATAHALLVRGARVVAVCRDEGSARALAQGREFAAFSSTFDTEAADLSHPAEVIALADRIRARSCGLDLLVNAAGVQPWTRRETPDGIELTWATNVLAPFLLTEAALPVLEGAQGQVLNVASMVHRWGNIDWADPEKRTGYDANAAYYQSKLALLLLTAEAARRHADTGVRFNAMHPGMTRTAFARDFRGFYRLMARMTRPFQRNADAVADEIARIAFDPGNGAVTGGYFVRGRPTEPDRRAVDPASAARLWDLCVARAASVANMPQCSKSGADPPNPAIDG